MFGSTYQEAIAFSDRDWQSHMERGPYLVAEIDGSDVGILRLSVGDEPGTWWLYSLWIAPATRGTGLINEFLARAEALAHSSGAAHLKLDVARNNGRAISVYLRSGYETVEEGDASTDPLEMVLVKDLR